MRNLLPIAVAAFCAASAVAQPGTRTTTTVSYHRVSTVVGTTFSLGTTSVGKVTEVVFNDGGCIEYLIVQESEGFVVVPWTLVTVNYEQKVVTVQSTTVTVERLRELRFTEGRWPNFGDPAFTQRVQAVWGASATRPGADRKGTDRKDAGDRTKDPRTIPPADPKTKAPPKDPTKGEPPVKTPPQKDDPKKEKVRPEKEKIRPEKEKKDPDRR
jgi:hypothetical protein